MSEDIYANSDVIGKQGGNTRKRSIQGTRRSGRKIAEGRWSKTTVAFLALLCVFLLGAVIVLTPMLITVTKEKDQLQTSCNDLTSERDRLHTERDQLQRKVSSLDVIERQCERYFIVPQKKWEDAREHCQRENADLAIINSTEEQIFINTHFRGLQAWIGLTDKKEEGKFEWVDGTPLTTRFWWEGEPNNWDGNEDCVITGAKFAKTNVSTWADYPCEHSATHGICERLN